MKQLDKLDGGNQGEERNRRMTKEKLVKDFKEVIQKFAVCEQSALSKDRTTVSQQRDRSSFAEDKDRYEGNQDDERSRLVYEDQHRNLSQMDAQIDYSSALIQEREEGIKEIEATMQEVNDIYRDLGTIVHEQGDMLDNIEANMSSVDHHVETGAKELVKANHYQKKTRNKMCCVLVIVVVVAAILTIVLVTKLK